jgi:hypothetical protein
LEELGREMMARCRHLVETRGRKIDRGNSFSYHYRDGVVDITWEFIKGMQGDAHMVVKDVQSEGVLGSYHNQFGGPQVGGPRAEPYVKHLRSIMVLDDIARRV